MLLEMATYMGPARVLRVEGNKVCLTLPGQTVWARLALACFYQPEPGDTVLVLGQGEDYYIVGVLHGTGKTTVTVPADFELRAPAGTIDLFSARGIRLRAPSMNLQAGKLEILARSIREKFVNACRRVRECLQIKAGRVRTVSEGSYEVRAKRVVECAVQDVRIDGKTINLG